MNKMEKKKKKGRPQKNMCVDLIIVGSYDAMVFVILLVDKLLVKENIKASFA